MTRSSAEAALDRMNWRAEAETTVEDVVREALKYTSRG
jgi:hypothetical protein